MVNVFESEGREVIQGIFRDITEQKKAQLQREELINELEEINSIMTGRELKMIELKKQINKLSGELGRRGPYADQELEE